MSTETKIILVKIGTVIAAIAAGTIIGTIGKKIVNNIQ